MSDIHETLQAALTESVDENELELLSSDEVEANYKTDVGKKSEAVKKSLEALSGQTTSVLLALEDFDGEPIPTREDGTLAIQMISLEDFAFAGNEDTLIRRGDLKVYDLQRNIEQVGVINPLHVVPFGNVIGEDALGNPTYSKYIILDGRRRYEACRNLGLKYVPAIVNTTINNALIEFYQGIIQSSKAYTFSELTDYAKRLSSEQKNLNAEMIEVFLGMKAGDFLKSMYIDQFKVDYPDIYLQVEKGKMTIEQGFKKLEKEIEKAEKQLEEGDLDADMIDEELRGKNVNELDQLQLERQQQTVGDRRILDPVVRRSVESRDNGECQACGYGHGESDFVGVFNVHHIVAVMYGGSDGKDNLILLCQNCHKLVHDYENGRFNPEQSTFDKYIWVKRVIVLGNILRNQRMKANRMLKQADKNTYRVFQSGNIGLGKAIEKAGLDLKAEADYLDDNGNPSPYAAFRKATENLEFGGDLKGDLAKLNDLGEEEFEKLAEDLEEEDKPSVQEPQLPEYLKKESGRPPAYDTEERRPRTEDKTLLVMGASEKVVPKPEEVGQEVSEDSPLFTEAIIEDVIEEVLTPTDSETNHEDWLPEYDAVDNTEFEPVNTYEDVVEVEPEVEDEPVDVTDEAEEPLYDEDMFGDLFAEDDEEVDNGTLFSDDSNALLSEVDDLLNNL